jgi:hypothetical protein
LKKIDTFEIDPFNVTFEPLAGSSFSNLLRLLAENRFRVSLIGIPRILYSLTLSSIQSPLNVLERRYFNKHIKHIDIDKPPIFILGHWRTGSTYLHNLITQDPRFGFPTTLQTVIPALFLKYGELFRPVVDASLPEKRPQDDVAMGADLPQEEEYALGNLSPYSYYNGWCFPKNMEHYNNFVDLKEMSPREYDEFKEVYLDYVKKVSYASDHKQLVLKNPSNTSRIKFLLELFPDAKFIHIIRNPYHVYLSMKRNIEKEMILYTVQNPPSWKIFEKSMVNMYRRMYEKYFNEKELIPQKNFTEVRYEDFVQKPIKEIERMYQELGLNDFDKNKTIFEKYVDSQEKVKKAVYAIDDNLKNHIYTELKDAIDRWNYSM